MTHESRIGTDRRETVATTAPYKIVLEKRKVNTDIVYNSVVICLERCLEGNSQGTALTFETFICVFSYDETYTREPVSLYRNEMVLTLAAIWKSKISPGVTRPNPRFRKG